MPHHKNQLWIHIVFSTREREDLISPDIEKELHEYIAHRFAKERYKVEAINGTANHIHILVKPNLRDSIAEVIGRIKGSSSYWMNRHPKMKRRFDWQQGYSVYAVSSEGLPKVSSYINNQKIIHAKRQKDNE